MAFKMKRPIIKGTPLHKASTESIVAQTRTQADGTLVDAGGALGRSYIPIAIDYSNTSGLIDFGDDKDDKKKDVKKVKKKKENTKTAEVIINGVQTTVPWKERFDYEAVKKVKYKKAKKKEEVKKYVSEAEDKDIVEDAGQDDKSTVHPNKKGGDKENWKEKEKRKNIAEAEAIKKRSYEASKKRVEADIANEENDYSGIASDNSGSTSGSVGSKAKPYENWKVREDKRNIAEAEAIKKRLDEASKKRTDAKKNNTNFDWNSNTDIDIVAPEAPKYQKPKSKVKVDPSISAAETKAKKEFDNRDRTAMSPIEPKAVVELPNNTPDPKLKKAGTVPNAKERLDADKDPDYASNIPKLNAEGKPVYFDAPNPHDQFAANLPEDAKDHFTGSYDDYAYTTVMRDIDGDGEYDEEEVWTYKGEVINENQVSTAAHTSILGNLSNQQEQRYKYKKELKQTNLNSNTPSRGSSSVDLLPQPPPAVNNEAATTTTRTRKQKENDKIYNDFRTSKYTKNKMIEEGYNPIKSKSPMEMRDDRIYRNARADGPVRKNMIKGGYKPQ